MVVPGQSLIIKAIITINIRKRKYNMDFHTKPKNQTEANISKAEMEMAKYGITYRGVNYFHYKDFKYTNLDDAFAQAKRNKEVS